MFTGLGSSLGFTVFALYPLTLGSALQTIGVPPPEWFQSDHVDIRGAFVIMACEVCILGLLFFWVGRVAGRRWGALSRAQAFALTSPLALIGGYSLFRGFVPDLLFPYEFHQGSFWTALIGWPVFWYLARLGGKPSSWRRAAGVVVAYSLAMLALLLYRIYQLYSL